MTQPHTAPHRSRRFCLHSIMRVGILTLLSRLLGFIRELLLMRCLGKSAQSDGFITAFRLPNLLYKICAGGALSPAVVPIGVMLMRKEGAEELSRFMSTLLAIVSIILSAVCTLLMIGAPWVVQVMAPGFSNLQTEYTIFFIRTITGFVILTTASALLSEALRIARHFTVPALGQAIFNMVCIAGLVCYYWWSPTNTMLAMTILVGGIVQLVPHLWMYMRAGFSWRMPSAMTWRMLRNVGTRVIPSATTASMAEVGSLVELQLASFLPVGSVSLLSYTSMFVHVPLGIFATAFSTVIFPDMVRITAYAPRRLGYLLLESVKLIWWILVPCSLLLIFFSYDIFATLYTAGACSEAFVEQAHFLLIIRSLSILPLAINKFLLNGLYALHDMRTASILSLAGTIFTVICALILMPWYGVYGLAWASTLVAYVRMGALMLYLNRTVHLYKYQRIWHIFVLRALGQLASLSLTALPLYFAIRTGLRQAAVLCDSNVLHTLSDGWALWIWVGIGICRAVAYAWVHRHTWNMHMYFLDRRSSIHQSSIHRP